MIARSSAYVFFLETVVGKSDMYVEEKGRQRTDPCGTPFLRRRNLLRLPFPVVRVKLRLPTISMVMWAMCLSGSHCSSLHVRPQCHTVLKAAVRSTYTAPAFFSWKAILDVLCQQGDLVYARSRVRSPPASVGAVSQWSTRHECRWVSRI